MEKQIEQKNDSIAISQRAQQSSEILGWLAEQITVLAEAMAEPMTQARLKIYIGDLADLQRSQLELAFTRARRESEYFPRIAKLRELAGQGAKEQGIEARAAWDVLQKFVSKYVSNDVHGNFGPQYGWYSAYPKLADRILDVVRRTGGWKVYKCMDSEDMPFTQKRFFEEYEAWTAVQHIPSDRMLLDQSRPALRAAKQEPGAATAKQVEVDRIARVAVKEIPVPMTQSQMRDRREMLRQQTEFVRKRYGATLQILK